MVGAEAPESGDLLWVSVAVEKVFQHDAVSPLVKRATRVGDVLFGCRVDGRFRRAGNTAITIYVVRREAELPQRPDEASSVYQITAAAREGNARRLPLRESLCELGPC